MFHENSSLKNTATIRIWNYGTGKIGHVSLQTRGFTGNNETKGVGEEGIYVSIYPLGRGLAVFDTTGKPLKTRTLEEDYAKYKTVDVVEITLHTLDITKIENTYKDLVAQGFKFSLSASIWFLKDSKKQNCSGLVALLLQEGGIDDLILSEKKNSPLLVGLASGVFSSIFLAHFAKNLHTSSDLKMDLLKTSILTLYLMGGLSLTRYSNYKSLPLVNGLSLLAGSLFGFFQFEKIRSVYFIRPVLKTLMFFGINSKKVTIPIIRFANALNQSAYGGFFLRPLFQPTKKLNMDFEAVAAKVKEKIPENFNPKLVLAGMLSMKVFIENISWLGLSAALSVGMLYSSNNTVANLRKKAIITPQDVHKLVTTSAHLEAKSPKRFFSYFRDTRHEVAPLPQNNSLESSPSSSEPTSAPLQASREKFCIYL